jgi:hypothetical protein
LKYLKRYEKYFENDETRHRYDSMDFAFKVAREFGEEVSKKLGAGSFGHAYLLDSGKVMKLTYDENEVIYARKLAKKPWTKYIINYYGVRKLDYNISGVPDNDEGQRYDVYGIIMDRVFPLLEDDLLAKVIMHVYQPLIQYTDRYYENITNIKKIRKELKSTLETENINDKEEFERLVWEIYPNMVELVKELKKYHIPKTDFHDENIGWCYTGKKRLVLFDLGGYI